MTVTFGWQLDARQGPLLVSRFNAPVVGRLGLLGLLELHLGLAGPSIARSQRVAAYLGHLRKADDGKRFYSMSLHADEMGVASELLGWRDEWLLYGWDGTAPDGAPNRVADMAAVEALARGQMPPAEAERLAQVEAALRSCTVQVSEVRLLDDLDRFPARWRGVLSHLPVHIDSALAPMAPDTSSTLGRLQQAAVASTASGLVDSLTDVADDGSVQVYRCENTDTAIHWLALHHGGTSTSQILVCERDGLALDDIFRANGEPVCGFDRPSPYRPALQVLPLALELMWRPVDVHRVLEFLTHPYGPFRRKARWLLARAYATQPGYGGEEWAAAKESIKELDGGEELLAQVAFWFEGQHWERAEGAPLAAVEQRVERVVGSMRVLMGTPRDDVLAVAGGIKQAEAVLDALAELKFQGVERLRPRHVEQLLAEATIAGGSNPYAEPEVGCRRSTTTSALVVLEPAQEVVWWMPSKPMLPRPHPWSLAEREALRLAGAELQDIAAELRALARDWLRPVLAAQERFVLVLPLASEEEHPIWLLVRRLLPMLAVRHVEEELTESTRGESVSDKPLPQLKRYLDIPADMSSRRTRQSFTSLADLFDNPAVSALKDAAGLRSATLMAVEDERRLLGTLAHRLVERLFAVPSVLAWEATQVRTWFDGHADALIEAEGAPLLMLGFAVVLHRFRGAVCEAAVVLLRHLQSAGVVSVRTELPFEGTLFGVPVTGTVDLLAELSGSRYAVLDLKWSGEARYRERLATGTHLQLAIYSSLIEQNLGQAPAELAFFIFDSRALLVTSKDCFPNAQVCSPPGDASVKQLLARAEASWDWRNDQLAGGVLELVDPRLEELDAFQGPDGTLPVKESGPWNAEYIALLGWEEEA
ncbi:MAG: PD-(D/E)XK nuclease family protein [Burkholderiaceae bacterium]|nr:PD-(D/E)XK nuclease family protein [Burkholderiaceae bacterium]